MYAFWEIIASNAVVATILAIGVMLLGRIWKNAAAVHAPLGRRAAETVHTTPDHRRASIRFPLRAARGERRPAENDLELRPYATRCNQPLPWP